MVLASRDIPRNGTYGTMCYLFHPQRVSAPEPCTPEPVINPDECRHRGIQVHYPRQSYPGDRRLRRSPHPYRTLSDDAFWSRAVANHWNAGALTSGIASGTADSRRSYRLRGKLFCRKYCALYRVLSGTRMCVRRSVEENDDRFFYSRYSAAYGNVYTAKQFRQLIERSLGQFKPAEDRWITTDAVIDPFRPGLSFAS